jgi:hypothetical protein
MRMHYLLWALIIGFGFLSIGTASAPDPAGQQAAGIVAGVESGVGGKVIINEKTKRLEVRDDQGSLIDEMALGTSGKVVDVAGQEYRLSFGKDEMGRRSVLVRAGPSTQKPITLDVFGRKAVLSPEASLLATMGEGDEIFYEPSVCGQVYYIEGAGGMGSRVSRLAAQKREVAVLAKPSNPTGAGPGTRAPEGCVGPRGHRRAGPQGRAGGGGISRIAGDVRGVGGAGREGSQGGARRRGISWKKGPGHHMDGAGG